MALESVDGLVQNWFRRLACSELVQKWCWDVVLPTPVAAQGANVLIVAKRPQTFSAAIRLPNLIFDHPDVKDGMASISPRQTAQHLFLCFDFC